MDFNDFKCFQRWMALRESLPALISRAAAHWRVLHNMRTSSYETGQDAALTAFHMAVCAQWPEAARAPAATWGIYADPPDSVQFALAGAKIEIPRTECSSWLDGSFQRPCLRLALMAFSLRAGEKMRRFVSQSGRIRPAEKSKVLSRPS